MDYLLFLITIPSIPVLGNISNFDLLAYLGLLTTVIYFGTSNDDLFKHDLRAAFGLKLLEELVVFEFLV